MLNNNYENTYGNNPVLLLLLVYAINYHVTHFIIYLLTFRKHFSTLDISLIHIRLRSESEKKKKRSVRDSRTYTQIETQSFHRRVGGAGSCSKAEGLFVKRGWEEDGRGAPSYFTVITVTCYRARSLRHAINRRLPLLWVRG